MYDGDIFEHDGNRFRFTTEDDDTQDAPWEREDGHGVVSDWKQHAFGMGTKPPKAPGELILVWDSGSYRTYDFAETVRIARRDGWGVFRAEGDRRPTPRTRREAATMAAREDFERMRDWCADRWSYIGVVVHLVDDDGADVGESEALWGIESDAGNYLDEVAHDLAGEIIARLEHAAAA